MADLQQQEQQQYNSTKTDYPPRDSFDVTSIGRQHNSTKETSPGYSFGTGARSSNKVFITKAHEKRKAVINTQAIYNVATTVGLGPKFGFGTDDQRPSFKTQYPDSSVDLTYSLVDSQTVKFESTKAIHFGTEPRMNSKNAEALMANPETNLCTQSPQSFDYNPEDGLIAKSSPEFSFGPKQAKLGEKSTPRIHIPKTGTPRHVGPGSHTQPSGVGQQPSSARKSAPAWTFAGKQTAKQKSEAARHGFIDPSPELSSLGKQVVSSARSAPSCSFGSSTRDHSARTYLVVTDADRGPAAALPKPIFHLEMPRGGRQLPKPGL